ncbi:MAG: pyridoxine 5'-phosphate synthase, partial [Candidatus Wallbacteria bacterium]|nr:pyridoxine 5'-phosphate synthase [Candidatus Wallbacteria bacterium]
EITTEGGLDVSGQLKDISTAVTVLKKRGIFVSLFIDPDPAQVEASISTGADAVELHTGCYANAYKTAGCDQEWTRLRRAAFEAAKGGLLVFAGHGLDYLNVGRIKEIPEISEVNIGFAIIAMAVMVGLPAAVSDMKNLVR